MDRLEVQEAYLVDKVLLRLGDKLIDLSYVIKSDKHAILSEAYFTHKTEMDSLYDTLSLSADKVRLFKDKDGNIIYLMVLYTIKYFVGGTERCACGMYHPMSPNGDNVVIHPYQGRICW